MFKRFIKEVVGENYYEKLKVVVQFIRYVRDYIYRLINKKAKIFNLSKHEYKISKYSIKNRHVFFGYYDIKQVDQEEKRILAHSIPKNGQTTSDQGDIGYFYLANQKFEKITETRAWCWQQGSRLRWNSSNNNEVLFNNVMGESYVAEIWDTQKKTCVTRFKRALYDVDSKFSYGLSLDFGRLQYLRPGYGYNYLPYEFVNNAPADNGIWVVDMKTNSDKLIVSLEELAKKVDEKMLNAHYINHISISPDGDKFIFFHIWTTEKKDAWKTRLYVYDFKDNSLHLLEEVDQVSHYTWEDNENVIVTCITKSREAYYAKYNTRSMSKQVFGTGVLTIDGHPSMIHEKYMLTDKKPTEHNYHEVFIYSMESNSETMRYAIYTDPRLYDEKRCDLHARVMNQNAFIVDSSYEKGVRSMILFDKGGEKYE